jgi:hypothetical protein
MPGSVVLASANTSKVMIEGEETPGVVSIDYKITRHTQNIHSISTEERVGQYTGNMYVEGSVKIRSLHQKLDEKMYQTVPEMKTFQLILELSPQGDSAPVKKITFDECDLTGKEMGMDASGVAATTYHFRSTRVREE